MEVIRKCKKDVKKIQLGDQIVLGRYTATAVAQDSSGTTFCFDQVYGERVMKNPWDRNRAGTLYRSKAMDSVRDFLVPFEYDENLSMIFRSPTAEEVASKNLLCFVVPTTISGADKRWDAAKKGHYRFGMTIDGVPCAYWLNSISINIDPESSGDEKYGQQCFLDVNGRLAVTKENCENHLFWRPVFKLRA